MYNEDLKKKFVREYTQKESTAQACEALFNITGKYEAIWCRDICTMNEEIVAPIMEKLIGVRGQSKWMRILILRSYAKWCIRNKVPNACRTILNIQVSGLSKIKQQMVSSPAHLEKYLNEICEPASEQRTDNIYRSYYWLAYAGMKEEDILKVRCSDIDFDNMVVRYEDTEYPIYREAVPALKNCTELTQFKYGHPNYTADKDVWIDRVPGDTVIRGIRGQMSAAVIRVELSRRSKRKREEGATDLQLSHYRVWVSGLFYRTYELERMGIEPDFTDIAYSHCRGKSYKLDSGHRTQNNKLRQWAREYLDDYQRWKLAYNN